MNSIPFIFTLLSLFLYVFHFSLFSFAPTFITLISFRLLLFFVYHFLRPHILFFSLFSSILLILCSVTLSFSHFFSLYLSLSLFFFPLISLSLPQQPNTLSFSPFSLSLPALNPIHSSITLVMHKSLPTFASVYRASPAIHHPHSLILHPLDPLNTIHQGQKRKIEEKKRKKWRDRKKWVDVLFQGLKGCLKMRSLVVWD